MSFSSDLKEELLRIEPENACCQLPKNTAI